MTSLSSSSRISRHYRHRRRHPLAFSRSPPLGVRRRRPSRAWIRGCSRCVRSRPWLFLSCFVFPQSPRESPLRSVSRRFSFRYGGMVSERELQADQTHSNSEYKKTNTEDPRRGRCPAEFCQGSNSRSRFFDRQASSSACLFFFIGMESFVPGGGHNDGCFSYTR